MKKFLLVAFIGMALAINVYGFIDKYILIEDVYEINHIEETTTAVYME